MRFGLQLFLALVFSSQVFSSDYVKEIEESLTIFAHDSNILWTSFLAGVHSDQEYVIPETCLSKKFAKDVFIMKTLGIQMLEDIFSNI